MVMEYSDHDLKMVLWTQHRPLEQVPSRAGISHAVAFPSLTRAQSQVKCLFKQLLLGMAALHDNWIIHRCPRA
jgi:serine/threonine protein kinase